MKRIDLRLLFLFLAFTLHLQAQEAKQKEFSLNDPFFFKTAEKMYAVATVLPYSSKADALVNEITRSINKGVPIENTIVWANLQKLEPYRMTSEVQEAVKIWVEQAAEHVLKQKDVKEVPIKTLKQISTTYKAGNFDRVVQESLKELLTDPESPDLRNNLALALIHQNKDLCAQVELEVLLRLFEDFPAGLINLTVVYERMNRSGDIEELLEKLERLQQENDMEIPEARFNAHWMTNKKGSK